MVSENITDQWVEYNFLCLKLNKLKREITSTNENYFSISKIWFICQIILITKTYITEWSVINR